jgi:serine/threonine protein kinase
MEIIASRYRLEEKIGTGGEARVFRARDLTTDGEVAVRFSPAGEAHEAVGEIPDHPGWVRLLDCGVDSAQGAYAVFELLHGETLGAMVKRDPLEPEVWRDFARQSLDALAALHRAGWVHGDLNADNFFLDGGTTWKLLELPFHQAPTAGARSAFFGSIFTMAPEQFGGRAVNASSDLYALGCLYYYAASGTYPHAGGSEAEIAVGRLRFPAAPLHERAPRFPRAWADWVMRLLEREPINRPADAGAARQLLDVIS